MSTRTVAALGAGRRRIFVVWCIIAGLATACMATVSPAFDPEDCRPYAAEGTAEVVGELNFLFGGREFRGSHVEVLLVPETPHTLAWFTRAHLGRAAVKLDDRVREFVRYETSDDDGKFRFQHLPAGRYLVMTWFERGNAIWAPWTYKSIRGGAQVDAQEGTQAHAEMQFLID